MRHQIAGSHSVCERDLTAVGLLEIQEGSKKGRCNESRETKTERGGLCDQTPVLLANSEGQGQSRAT
jgi:hypothetical protein